MNENRRQKGSILNRILIIVAIIVFAIVFMLNRIWVANYNSEITELNNEVSQIANQYVITIQENNNYVDMNDIDSEDEGETISSADIDENYEKAVSFSQEAIDKENEYLDLLYGGVRNKDNYDEVSEQLIDLSIELDDYFENPNPVTTWYMWLYSEYEAAWYSSVLLDYNSDGDRFPVFFYCKDIDDNLLAFVLTEYDVENNILSDCNVYMTTVGSYEVLWENESDAEIEGEDVSDESFQDSVSSLAEIMKDYWDDNVEDDNIPNTNVIDDVDEEQ